MSSKSNNSKIASRASWLAGSAMVGNAIFGHQKESAAWTIIVVYVLFGGIVGFFKYLGNVFRWLSYDDVSWISRLMHTLLPPLSLVGGYLGWTLMIELGETNGLAASGVALLFQAAIATWCFYLLQRVNAKELKEDQVSFATASYMYIGTVYALALVWAFSMMKA